jgi:hypothetical protein
LNQAVRSKKYLNFQAFYEECRLEHVLSERLRTNESNCPRVIESDSFHSIVMTLASARAHEFFSSPHVPLFVGNRAAVTKVVTATQTIIIGSSAAHGRR